MVEENPGLNPNHQFSVNPRGLRVPAFAGRVREHALLCVRVVLAAGAGRVEKFFVRITEC